MRGGGRVQSDDLRPDVPVGGPGICGDGPLLLLFIGDDLSKNFNFFSSNFKIFSSFSGMSRLELDSAGSGPGDSGNIGVRGGGRVYTW